MIDYNDIESAMKTNAKNHDVAAKKIALANDIEQYVRKSLEDFPDMGSCIILCDAFDNHEDTRASVPVGLLNVQSAMFGTRAGAMAALGNASCVTDPETGNAVIDKDAIVETQTFFVVLGEVISKPWINYTLCYHMFGLTAAQLGWGGGCRCNECIEELRRVAMSYGHAIRIATGGTLAKDTTTTIEAAEMFAALPGMGWHSKATKVKSIEDAISNDDKEMVFPNGQQFRINEDNGMYAVSYTVHGISITCPKDYPFYGVKSDKAGLAEPLSFIYNMPQMG